MKNKKKRIKELEEGLKWFSNRMELILDAAIEEYPRKRLGLEQTKFFLKQKTEYLLTKKQ